MSLTFKDYKINHIAFLFIKVLTFSQKTSENSKFSAFDRSNLLLDRSKNEEIHHKGSTLFDWFSILVRSIEINIRSVERNSRSIETMKNFIIEFLPDSIGSRFLFYQSKSTFDQSKLVKSEFFQNFAAAVFHSFCYFPSKTPFWFYEWRFTNQTLRFSRSLSRTLIMLETLENIILISLGINIIILALAYCWS